MDNSKKEKLTNSYKALLLKHEELVKCSADLTSANEKLNIQYKEKDKRASELAIINLSLKKSEERQQEHILGLEKMLFMISHKIRQPVAQILGLSDLIENEKYSPKEFKEMLVFIKQSAHSLDTLTRELSKFIQEKKTDSENIIKVPPGK